MSLKDVVNVARYANIHFDLFARLLYLSNVAAEAPIYLRYQGSILGHCGNFVGAQMNFMLRSSNVADQLVVMQTEMESCYSAHNPIPFAEFHGLSAKCWRKEYIARV